MNYFLDSGWNVQKYMMKVFKESTVTVLLIVRFYKPTINIGNEIKGTVAQCIQD